jgi:hypothetical protein
VVEWLLSKCEALSLNPVPLKKKKKRNGEGGGYIAKQGTLVRARGRLKYALQLLDLLPDFFNSCTHRLLIL